MGLKTPLFKVEKRSISGARVQPQSMASTSTPSAIQPNTTLYINNLNDKINRDELRAQLFALFTTYGKLIDVVASKGAKMRGQAFLVFTDLAGATSAMRACEGMVFYDKPMVRTSFFSSERLRLIP
jgi:RNA recognition motif-containing protein